MRIDLGDIIALLGCLTMGYGVWLIYQPAAIIIEGLVLVMLGLAWSRINAKVGSEPSKPEQGG